MNTDQLFLLKPDFIDDGERFYCPDCAELTGLLEFYPNLKSRLTIRFIDFPRPRPELVNLVGEENQGCPVLVLAAEPPPGPVKYKLRHARGQRFISGARDIAEYFAQVHGTGRPH